MELRSIILCEYASIRPDGIFNIVGGGIRRIATAKLPIVFSASMLIILDCALEEGTFEMNLQLRDADGKKLFNLKQPFRVRPQSGVHTSVFRFERLKLERTGDYSFEVFVGGRSVGSYALNILLRPARPQV